MIGKQRDTVIAALNEAEVLASSLNILKNSLDVLREEGGKAKLIIRTKSGHGDCTTELTESTAEGCIRILIDNYNEKLSALQKQVSEYISNQRMEVF